MARTRRRTSRRTISQRAAGLIALALPAPVQRIADTRIGSLLMLLGFPIMILFGLLNVTMVDGFPTFSLDRNKAAELRKAARDKINDLEHQAALQNWGQPAVDLLHAAQGSNHTHQTPAFPSAQPQAASSMYDWQQQQLRQQQNQPTYPQQPYPQQPYQQQPYPQQTYQQQPAYSGQQPYPGSYSPTYSTNGQPPAAPSGWPAQPYNHGYTPPSTSNSGQIPYTHQGGQLGRY